MQSQFKVGVRQQVTCPNWLPRRSSVLRRSLRVNATSGAAPPPTKEALDDTVTRQYRRTVYDFALWRKHRDVNRYLYNLKTIPGSRIIRTLSQPMGVVLAWAAFFGFYESCLESGILPADLPKLTLTSAEPQGLTSFALSLLLVFRTNSSYGRFDEARKIWGGILNRARNIANQAVSFVAPEDPVGREAVGKWTVGFCRALQAHLQEDANLREELQKAQPRWSQEEIEILCSAQHRPIKAISMLSELTRQLSITEFQALQMQENVTFFYDALGGCERLLRTPIPVSYTRHTARFLTIWLSLLPLGLWDRYHWSMLPVIALIGFLLLGIDEIGITIEEPFGILPLDAICTRAQTDVVSLIKDDSAVSAYISDLRGGRIKQPAEPVAIVPAAPPAAAAAVALARSSSPISQTQPPGMLRTVTSMFSNVKAGIGAVAPGAPPPPQPRTPSPARSASPRATSPSRPNPFPPASAGTGTMPPQVLPLAAVAAASNGSSKVAPALPPPPPTASSNGFTLMSGLARSASAAAARVSKLADSMTSGTPLASEASPPPEPTIAPEPLAAQAQPASAAVYEASASSSAIAPPAVSAPSAPANGRLAASWRDELAALKANRDEGVEDEEPAASESDGGESDDEALRRFGSLAGRSRSAAGRNGHSGNGDGNGNGHSEDEASQVRPKTRPDWRDRL